MLLNCARFRSAATAGPTAPQPPNNVFRLSGAATGKPDSGVRSAVRAKSSSILCAATVLKCSQRQKRGRLLKSVKRRCSTETSQLVPASSRDLVDSLRAIGLDSMITLPSIVVGGDTSAGKSSLLTAISGLQFPSNTGLTTRCPTEVILKRSESKSAEVTLRYFPGAEEEEQVDFRRVLKNDWSDFASVVTEATELLTKGQDANYITPNAIVVHAEGPDQPDLTLIDLPGLVAATGEGESSAIIANIREMITGYMQSSRSVILCVLPANNDFHNSAILTMAKECDPTGDRTLGIVTKPDLVDRGSEGEVVKLARNEQVSLALGWHTVKLRSQQDLSSKKTLAEAQQEEMRFFDTQPWSELYQADVGVPQLATRLQNILDQRVRSELPSVCKEVRKHLKPEEDKLTRIGREYVDGAEQREVFVTTVGRCTAMLEDASGGQYGGDFFAQADPAYCNNLRARIFALEETFKKKIGQTRFMCIGHYGVGDKIVKKYGGKASVVFVYSDKKRVDIDDGDGGQTAKVSEISPDHSDMLEMLRNVRGDNLPGFENDSVFRSLVAENLAPWSEPAMLLCRGTSKLMDDLATRVVEHVVPLFLPRLRQFLKNEIRQAVKECTTNLEVRMHELLKQERERPYTQNPLYMQLLTKYRSQLLSRIQSANYEKAGTLAALEAFGIGNSASLEKATAVELEFRLASYLEVASKRFIDEMPRIVDTILVKPVLAKVHMLQAHAAGSTLSSLFAQDDKVKHERAVLRSRVKVLREAIMVIEGYVL